MNSKEFNNYFRTGSECDSFSAANFDINFLAEKALNPDTSNTQALTSVPQEPKPSTSRHSNPVLQSPDLNPSTSRLPSPVPRSPKFLRKYLTNKKMRSERSKARKDRIFHNSAHISHIPKYINLNLSTISIESENQSEPDMVVASQPDMIASLSQQTRVEVLSDIHLLPRTSTPNPIIPGSYIQSNPNAIPYSTCQETLNTLGNALKSDVSPIVEDISNFTALFMQTISENNRLCEEFLQKLNNKLNTHNSLKHIYGNESMFQGVVKSTTSDIEANILHIKNLQKLICLPMSTPTNPTVMREQRRHRVEARRLFSETQEPCQACKRLDRLSNLEKKVEKLEKYFLTLKTKVDKLSNSEIKVSWAHDNSDEGDGPTIRSDEENCYIVEEENCYIVEENWNGPTISIPTKQICGQNEENWDGATTSNTPQPVKKKFSTINR